MPIYEYICQSCQSQFEKLVKSMSQTDPIPCPKCNSTDTQRTLSVFAVKGETASASAGGGHVHSGGCCCGRGDGQCPRQ